MIIVSQDNKKIFNFDNISLIFIQHENEIWVDTEKTCNLLGEYATEERAKEVLIGIVQAYIDSENYKYVNRFMTSKELDRCQDGLIYEMPEE